MSLEISKRLSLPIDAARWTFADLAIKGAGKSYSACVLAEEMVKAGIPIIAVDPMGIWWGLRVGINGHEGLPVVVFGGRHKDLPIPALIEKGREVIDESRLKLMVKAILEARMSAVLDTSDFSKGMQRRIVGIFVSELYRLNQDYGVRHVFLEEADEWIPQRLRAGDEWASLAFGAVDDLVRKGGNFLLGCTLITQRSAVLNKDVLTQINCLIALRILHKLDKAAVRTWIESVANPEDKRTLKFVDSLKDLKNGEAWIWHPEDPAIFERIQFRERETLHATREYFTRSKFEQKDIAMMDVGEFVNRFKKTFEPKPKPQTETVQQIHDRVAKEMDEYASKPRSESAPRVEVTSIPHPQTTLSPPLNPTVSTSEVVNQTLPNITIRQFKPDITISVESLDQPTSPLGRAVVVMKNDAISGGRQDKWTIKRIIEHVERHGWPSDGIGEAVGQLQRWEILVRGSDNYYRFAQSRVQITEAKEQIPA